MRHFDLTESFLAANTTGNMDFSKMVVSELSEFLTENLSALPGKEASCREGTNTALCTLLPLLLLSAAAE